jgi:fructokinase
MHYRKKAFIPQFFMFVRAKVRNPPAGAAPPRLCLSRPGHAPAALALIAPRPATTNLAIAVSHLDGGAAFIRKLRDHNFGRMLAFILHNNGVNDGGVVIDAGACTTLAFITLRADGEHKFMFYHNPSAGMLLTTDELNVELMKKLSLINCSSPSVI